MSDVLDRIAEAKREHVADCRVRTPLDVVERSLADAPAPRGFVRALRDTVERGGTGLIAEIKRSSPSGGALRPELDPSEIARAYVAGGASCLSVLTDAPFFGGRLADLSAAREATVLPVLQKDFILDPYQLTEARAAGADAVLLILSLLGRDRAVELEAMADGLGLDVLIEVHDEEELDWALAMRSPLVGINNRDLRTLRTDLAVTERLAPLVPADRIVVCESGIGSAEQRRRIERCGVRCFLVGESLLRQDDIAAATVALLRDQAA